MRAARFICGADLEHELGREWIGVQLGPSELPAMDAAALRQSVADAMATSEADDKPRGEGL